MLALGGGFQAYITQKRDGCKAVREKNDAEIGRLIALARKGRDFAEADKALLREVEMFDVDALPKTLQQFPSVCESARNAQEKNA